MYIYILKKKKISLFISHWNIWLFVNLLSQTPINMYIDGIDFLKYNLKFISSSEVRNVCLSDFFLGVLLDVNQGR